MSTIKFKAQLKKNKYQTQNKPFVLIKESFSAYHLFKQIGWFLILTRLNHFSIRFQKLTKRPKFLILNNLQSQIGAILFRQTNSINLRLGVWSEVNRKCNVGLTIWDVCEGRTWHTSFGRTERWWDWPQRHFLSLKIKDWL